MIKRLTRIIRQKRIWYNGKSDGICPICKSYIIFNEKEKLYKCTNEDCDYTKKLEAENINLPNNNLEIN